MKSDEPSDYALDMRSRYGNLEDAAKAGAILRENRAHAINLRQTYQGYNAFMVFGCIAYDVLKWASETGHQYAWHRQGEEYVIITTAQWPEATYKPRPKHRR